MILTCALQGLRYGQLGLQHNGLVMEEVTGWGGGGEGGDGAAGG